MNYLVYDTLGLTQRFFETFEEARAFLLEAREAYRNPSVLRLCTITESHLARL